MKMKRIALLFFTMLKIGAFTFGGGYAMIALLENEFVTKRAWLEREEFLDVAAIAESTPGPIAINAATYVGYKNAGFFGSLVATLGICLPSFAIIYLISLFFDAFLSLVFVQYAFLGIRVGVVYLIFTAGLRMLRKMRKKPLPLIVFSIVLLATLLLALFSVRISTVVWILAAGAVGISAHFARKIKKGGMGV